VRVAALGVAAALGIDAYVHATTASFYDAPHAGLITEGNLFRAETVVSAVLALFLLLRPSGRTLAAALVVAATAVGAVVLYRYVNIGAVGPIPNLYEPSWQVPGKLPSALAEASALPLSLVGLALGRRARPASSGGWLPGLRHAGAPRRRGSHPKKSWTRRADPGSRT